MGIAVHLFQVPRHKKSSSLDNIKPTTYIDNHLSHSALNAGTQGYRVYKYSCR